MRHFPTLSSRMVVLAIAGSFIAAACSTTASITPTATTGDSTAATPPADTAAVAETGPAAAESSWLDIELTDSTTGETFTIAGLDGELVAIEPFAVWCTNCHVQQDNVKAAYADLADAGVRFVSLGVEPSESVERIADYRERRGYEWIFAQSPTEMSRALADLFGAQILAVPATPLIIVAPDGEVVFTDFGFHGPDKLREIFEQAAIDAQAA